MITENSLRFLCSSFCPLSTSTRHIQLTEFSNHLKELLSVWLCH